MGFFDRFIKKDISLENKKESLYFHEDLYCQVELLPRENIVDLEKENEKIDDFAQEHFDGYGFTNIYIREGQRFKTSEREISIGDFEKIVIENSFIKYSKVYTGYSTYNELCKNTLGFELDSSVIYCDYENGLVKNIWIDRFRFSDSSDKKEYLINCLYAIGVKWNMILNDWDLQETIDLCNKKSIEQYISEEK